MQGVSLNIQYNFPQANFLLINFFRRPDAVIYHALILFLLQSGIDQILNFFEILFNELALRMKNSCY